MVGRQVARQAREADATRRGEEVRPVAASAFKCMIRRAISKPIPTGVRALKTGIQAGGFAVPVLLVTVVVVVAVLLHVLFAQSISNLTVEILAAIIAVVLVVASVAVTIHFQSRSETEHEYRVELFKQKVEGYRNLLDFVARTDDDEHICDQDIEGIRNRARTVALYADQDLIEQLAGFIERLERERVL